MLNQVVLVGRTAKEIKIKELDDGKKVANLTLSIPRYFKNENGEYDVDVVNIILRDGVAENTASYCHKGDVIGIKGRVQSNDSQIEIVAEKVTFLTSNKEALNENN